MRRLPLSFLIAIAALLCGAGVTAKTAQQEQVILSAIQQMKAGESVGIPIGNLDPRTGDLLPADMAVVQRKVRECWIVPGAFSGVIGEDGETDIAVNLDCPGDRSKYGMIFDFRNGQLERLDIYPEGVTILSPPPPVSMQPEIK